MDQRLKKWSKGGLYSLICSFENESPSNPEIMVPIKIEVKIWENSPYHLLPALSNLLENDHFFMLWRHLDLTEQKAYGRTEAGIHTVVVPLRVGEPIRDNIRYSGIANVHFNHGKLLTVNPETVDDLVTSAVASRSIPFYSSKGVREQDHLLQYTLLGEHDHIRENLRKIRSGPDVLNTSASFLTWECRREYKERYGKQVAAVEGRAHMFRYSVEAPPRSIPSTPGTPRRRAPPRRRHPSPEPSLSRTSSVGSLHGLTGLAIESSEPDDSDDTSRTTRTRRPAISPTGEKGKPTKNPRMRF